MEQERIIDDEEIRQFQQASQQNQEAMRRIAEKGAETRKPEATESLSERDVRILKNYAKAYALKNHNIEILKEIEDAKIVADTQVPDLSKNEMTVSFFKQKYPLLEE